MTIENPVAEHPFDADTRVEATDTPGRFRAASNSGTPKTDWSPKPANSQ